jgi:hypothetical protein
MKSAKIIIIFFVFFLIGYIGYILGHLFSFPYWDSGKETPGACTMEAKQCPDGSYVSRIPPDCEFSLCPGEKEGILVYSPKTNEEIESPLKIEGKARGHWFFEAQFNAVLLDAYGNKLGEAILTAKSDWMTEDFVPFEGELNFVQPSTPLGTLKFLNANPSGLIEHQRIFEVSVQFAELPYRKVLLYYYNPGKDKDESGNTKCSRDGLTAIEREIPVSKTPIQDVINLLLKGKENLTKEEIGQGVTTEYPLEGLYLAEVNFKEDGTLILKFNDLLNKTSGGSCRVGILWFQIEATAKQFEGVKEVRFLPEELFQP